MTATPDRETIAAVATPPGVGGVGIIRVSGSKAFQVAEAIAGDLSQPRHAYYREFKDVDGQTLDEGIVLSFAAPNSFTGEDVVEFQGHGGPVVMDLLLQRVLELGVRLARPGEFSERAFLNGKLDLAQAEAIADLIEAASADAARSAARSLQGEFSRRVDGLVEELIRLRMYVEAAIDFPEEEVDFLSDSKISKDLLSLKSLLNMLQTSARTGVVLKEGMRLVIAGRPNAGKSSLLNALAGRESAIVTEVPGTTRDVLREQVQIDGMPLHLVDTAGLRDTSDRIEQEGIRRAQAEIAVADLILWVAEDGEGGSEADIANAELPQGVPVLVVRNKIDLSGRPAGLRYSGVNDEITLSAKTGDGLDDLRTYLKKRMAFDGGHEGAFIARRRHLDAIERAAASLEKADIALNETKAGELVAEELRQAQNALSEITGAFTADDLLGHIFSSFCIGK